MKLSTLVLSASLLANVGLAIMLVVKAPDSASEPTADTKVAAASSARATGAVSVGSDSTGSATAPVGHDLWNHLKPGDDLATLVARLREAGFPPLMVSRIITTLVSEQFDSRRLKIEHDNLNAPYWEKTANSFMDPKIGPELRKLQVEQTETLKKLLGQGLMGLIDTDDGRALMRYQVGDLPADKLDRLYSSVMQYMDQRQQVYAVAGNGGTMLPSDREKVSAAEKAFRQSIAEFLSPDEASGVLMRMSETGGQLKYLLTPFRPTEAEYRTVYPIYQAFTDQFPTAMYYGDNMPADQVAARKAAEQAMYDQFKTVLGDARGAELEQAMNPQNSTINRLVARLELPMSAAKQVSDIQQDSLQRLTSLRMDPSLARAERDAQLTSLVQEASSKLTEVLGSRGLDAYKQYGGQWLVNALPRRTAPPKK